MRNAFRGLAACDVGQATLVGVTTLLARMPVRQVARFRFAGDEGMRSTPSKAARLGFLLAIGIISVMPSMSRAQAPYVPGGSGGSWGGYAPGYSWGAYAPGSAWIPYTPGTPTVISPPSAAATVPTQPSQPVVLLPGTQPIVIATQPIYPTAPVARPRTLINGVSNPVRGATPYADGRARNYYEYGSGRRVPLAKPWLPGAPGG